MTSNDALLGLYFHIPFCLRKCGYCDFCSYPSRLADREAYVQALLREIRAYAPRVVEREIDTVYFGGGTPSLLSVGQIATVLNELHSNIAYRLWGGAEITLEVNPATVTPQTLTAYRQMGINRLSIGVQSFHDGELAALGRLHTAADARACVEAARQAGFDNISIDLMYGIPHQTLDSFTESLKAAIALAPEHVSAYSLKVEEGTPFAQLGDGLPLPDEDTEFAMYETCVSLLGEAGYEHYEVSNYARPHHRSRHNLHYWRGEEYVGFGVAAHSYFEGYRYGCDRDLDAYLARAFDGCPHGDFIDEQAAEEEAILLGLRLSDGISDNLFARRFGVSFTEKYGAKLAPFVRGGFVLTDNGRTRLTDRGMYVMNAILAEILT